MSEQAEVGTFMLADLAGFTALTEAHGDGHAAEVAHDFCHAVRELAADYDAQEVKTLGDAILIRLDDPADAVHLAARVVNDLGTTHRSLGVCAGVHTGTAVRRGDDWFGTAVNVAARVADLARAGEVVITAQTRADAGAALAPEQLAERGARSLKNVREPVELFALLPQDPESAPLPVDPVCRMAVDPAQAAATLSRHGRTHHFCSEECLRAFEADPSRYGARSGLIRRAWARLSRGA